MCRERQAGVGMAYDRRPGEQPWPSDRQPGGDGQWGQGQGGDGRGRPPEWQYAQPDDRQGLDQFGQGREQQANGGGETRRLREWRSGQQGQVARDEQWGDAQWGGGQWGAAP